MKFKLSCNKFCCFTCIGGLSQGHLSGFLYWHGNSFTPHSITCCNCIKSYKTFLPADFLLMLRSKEKEHTRSAHEQKKANNLTSCIENKHFIVIKIQAFIKYRKEKKIKLCVTVVVIVCDHASNDVNHFTALSSTEWRCISPSSNLVNGHVSTMYNIVWTSPHWHLSSSTSLQIFRAVRNRFSRDHSCLGRIQVDG